ncbi:hypothetical protein U6A24_16670 [Aquimarina gracilis]|uniref:Uncharacterized protein n=1 Tax=Aquimarina gracilis TaxID=874422 RepID=A0ABU5ZYW8_9FLAO|nr:hypothetical protein [Aquimarina gracilis]MEB3347109.1 hypothetical protein [Aquimarina gracilis]
MTTFTKSQWDEFFEKVGKRLNGNEDLSNVGSDLFSSLKNKLGNKLDDVQWQKFKADFGDNADLLKEFDDSPDLVNTWRILFNLGDDVVPQALRKDPNFLSKFDDVTKNNNLGLDTDGVGDLLSSPKLKGQAWESPDAVLDAVKRGSDANIDGLSISHKKFPIPSEGNESFVLKNAKQYQKEASGDAALSFDKNGTSWDNIDANGKLVDRKYGHGASMFKQVDDGFGGKIIEVTNKSRADASIAQAERQVSAAGGKPIKWEISTELGAKGLRDLFDNSPNSLIQAIEVVHVPQVTIIP